MTLRDKLVALHASARNLHAETDELNAVYQQLEKELQGVGVEFWWDKKFNLGTEGGRVAHDRVGYAKIDNQWALAIVHLLDEEDPVASAPNRLTSAPRSMRVAFAGHVEEFVDALTAEVGKVRERVASAKSLAARSLK